MEADHAFLTEGDVFSAEMIQQWFDHKRHSEYYAVRKIGRITRYETKNYVGNTMIVDLDKASNPGQVAGTVSSGAVTTPPGGAAGTGTQTTPEPPPPKTP